MEKFSVVVEESSQGMRLDLFLVTANPYSSRSFFQNLIKSERVFVDLQPSKPNQRLKKGQIVDVYIPPATELEIKPQNIEIEIVYEDNDIAIVNKPQGMVVHPAPGNKTDTLVNALLAKLNNLSGINGQLRPGIVHRLDKDTSGLLVVAKNDFAHLQLAEQIKERSAKRTYLTIVHNVLRQDSGNVNARIGRHPLYRRKMAITDSRGSREALTRFKVLERFIGFTYLEVALETGRTHQIRVHMSGIGHPVLGDPVYGQRSNPFGLCKQALHAAKLTIKHPTTKEYMEFKANVPEDFEKTLLALRNQGDGTAGF